MESIEIMGNEILPEFIERDEKAVADKAKRLEPVIEKVEAWNDLVRAGTVTAFGSPLDAIAVY